MVLVDYKVLKPAVIKSCIKTTKNTNAFCVDIEKLNTLLEEQNLEVLHAGLEGLRVRPEHIPFISEYFSGSNLEWFNDAKFFTTLIAIDKTDINEEVRAQIDKLKVKPTDAPDVDYTNTVSSLVANYHCYFVMIVSYASSDPGRVGKNSYYLNCRANKVVLRDPDYVYNHKDMV